eukprot:6211203-Pleurochrysis_carterae.AAC.1
MPGKRHELPREHTRVRVSLESEGEGLRWRSVVGQKRADGKRTTAAALRSRKPARGIRSPPRRAPTCHFPLRGLVSRWSDTANSPSTHHASAPLMAAPAVASCRRRSDARRCRRSDARRCCKRARPPCPSRVRAREHSHMRRMRAQQCVR